MSIRSGAARDLPVLGKVFRCSSLSNESDRARLAQRPELLEYKGDALANGRTRVAVADDGQIVGFASFSLEIVRKIMAD